MSYNKDNLLRGYDIIIAVGNSGNNFEPVVAPGKIQNICVVFRAFLKLVLNDAW